MGLRLSKRSSAIYPSKKDSSDTGLRAKEAKRRLRREGGCWKLAETEGQTVYLFIPMSLALLQSSTTLCLPVVGGKPKPESNSFAGCNCARKAGFFSCPQKRWHQKGCSIVQILKNESAVGNYSYQANCIALPGTITSQYICNAYQT